MLEQTASAPQPKPQDTEAEDGEEPAWEFDEDVAEVESNKDEQSPKKAPQHGNGVMESPDPNADDAWGFDEDEIIGGDNDDQRSNASSRRANGHKRNSLSISSTRSRASQKSTKSNKGKGSQKDEDEDGGWSFDADVDAEVLEDTNAGDVASSTAEQEDESNVSNPGHSRNTSIDNAWGWSRNPDPDEDKPIGKPTKVIVSKKLGAKGRSGSPALFVETEAPSDISRSATPLARLRAEIDHQTPTQSVKAEVPEMHVVEQPEEQKTVKTKLVISSRAKRVCEVALQLLEAALAVTSAS